MDCGRQQPLQQQSGSNFIYELGSEIQLQIQLWSFSHCCLAGVNLCKQLCRQLADEYKQAIQLRPIMPAWNHPCGPYTYCAFGKHKDRK